MDPTAALDLFDRLASDPALRVDEVRLVARRAYGTAVGDPITRTYGVDLLGYRAPPNLWAVLVGSLPANVDVALTDASTLTIY